MTNEMAPQPLPRTTTFLRAAPRAAGTCSEAGAAGASEMAARMGRARALAFALAFAPVLTAAPAEGDAARHRRSREHHVRPDGERPRCRRAPPRGRSGAGGSRARGSRTLGNDAGTSPTGRVSRVLHVRGGARGSGAPSRGGAALGPLDRSCRAPRRRIRAHARRSNTLRLAGWRADLIRLVPRTAFLDLVCERDTARAKSDGKL